MSYASYDDLVARFGLEELVAIADRDRDDEPDSDVIEAALAKATNTINSYIGPRYALPLLTVPEVLKDICADLARHALYTVEPTKIVVDNRDAAIAFLKDISKGVAALDVPAPASADAASSGTQILVEGGDRSMSRSELRKL